MNSEFARCVQGLNHVIPCEYMLAVFWVCLELFLSTFPVGKLGILVATFSGSLRVQARGRFERILTTWFPELLRQLARIARVGFMLRSDGHVVALAKTVCWSRSRSLLQWSFVQIRQVSYQQWRGVHAPYCSSVHKTTLPLKTAKCLWDFWEVSKAQPLRTTASPNTNFNNTKRSH